MTKSLPMIEVIIKHLNVYNNRSFNLLLLTFIVVNTYGQGPEIEANDLDVIKSFEVKLEEAVMIKVKPQLPKVVPVKKKYDYQISIVPLELQYPAPIIKPLAMTETNEFNHYDQYIKLGYGTVNNPTGLGKFTFGDGDRYRVHIDAHHFSLDQSAKVADQKTGETRGNISGYARIGENLKVSTGIEGKNQFRYFYNENSQVDPLRLGSKRNITQGRTWAGISNLAETAAGVNYKLGISLAKIFKTQGFDTSPHRFTASGTLEKRASDHINIVVPVTFYGHVETPSDDRLFGGASFLEVRPAIHFQKGKLMARAGVNVGKPNGIASRIWPEAEIAYGVWGNYIQVLAATTQKASFNDFFTILDINPWVEIPDINIQTTIQQEYYGGVRGELNFLSYQGELGYAQAENLMLFNLNFDTEGKSRMRPIYDDAQLFFVRGNIDFAISDNMEIGGELQQNLYNMDEQDHHWGLPSLVMDAYFTWKLLKEKLSLRSDLSITDRVKFQNLNAAGSLDEYKLNNQVALNAHAEFWPSKYFGLHGYANNLLNNKYQRWPGLPTVGIHFGGGIMVKF